MLYAVIATDAPNSLQDRLATRPAHLARLEQLKNEAAWFSPARTQPSTATTRAKPGSAAVW